MHAVFENGPHRVDVVDRLAPAARHDSQVAQKKLTVRADYGTVSA